MAALRFKTELWNFVWKEKVEEVVISNKEFSSITGQVKDNVLQEGEEFYQKLWKSYFKHINIQESKNLNFKGNICHAGFGNICRK